MMSAQGVIIWLEGSLETQVVAALNAQAAKFKVVRRCADVAELESVVSAELGTAVICSADTPAVDAAFVERLHSHNVFVLLVYADPLKASSLGEDAICDRDAEAIVKALTTGIRRRILGSEDATAASPVEPLAAAGVIGEVETVASNGRVVAVWGTSGAPGRTTFAVNLAAALGRCGGGVTLVDADTRSPSITISLGLPVQASGVAAAAALRNRGELNRAVLEQLLQPLGSGVSVLSGLTRADRWRQLSAESLSQIFNELRGGRDVVVDLCDGFSDDDPAQLTFVPSREDINLSILREADVVIVVARADTVGLSRLNTVVLDCAQRHLAIDLIVLNRVRPEAMGTASTSALHEAMSAITTEVPYVLLPQSAKVDVAVLHSTTVYDSDPDGDFALSVEAALRATGLANPPQRSPRPRWKDRWWRWRPLYPGSDAREGEEKQEPVGGATDPDEDDLPRSAALPNLPPPPPPPGRRRADKHQRH